MNILWRSFGYIFIAFTVLLFQAHPSGAIELSDAERDYLKKLGPVTFCVDPDWEPFEFIDANGAYDGIAADLLRLAASRVGIELKLVRTKDWDESIAASMEGKCKLLSFLNQTPKRDGWLIFTSPIFNDTNVFITREEHPFIVDPSAISGESIVFPEGTSMEERIRKDYPNLRVITVPSERDVIDMVSSKGASMTVRSLIVAAYTIKKEGLFNLKIAGQLPGYDNNLRVGVVSSEPMLRDILEKGVLSISPVEKWDIANRHVSIKAEVGVDYGLVLKIVIIFIVALSIVVVWALYMRSLSLKLRESRRQSDVALESERQARQEQRNFLAMVSHEFKTPLGIISASASLVSICKLDQHEASVEFGKIQRAVTRMEGLIDTCLSDDWLDSSGMQARLGLVSVRKIVAEIVEERVGRVVAVDRLRVVEKVFFPRIVSDGQLLKIAISNLVDNAIKYSDSSASIEIFIDRNEGDVLISVADHGIGIEDDEVKYIFDKYYRSERVYKKGGAGLGLHIVRRISEVLGGGVEVESRYGEGSRFTLRLPFNATK